MVAIIDLQRGIPSKRKSSACVDYVPALCTHRPSLLPIEWFNEIFGLEPGRAGNGAALVLREVNLIESFRGSKSRNKVSVGEPAEGSLLPLVFVLDRAVNADRCRPFPPTLASLIGNSVGRPRSFHRSVCIRYLV